MKASKIIEQIKTQLHNASDLKTRSLKLFNKSVEMIYIADITDNQLLNDSIIFPITNYNQPQSRKIIDVLKDEILSSVEVKLVSTINEACTNLLQGKTIIAVGDESQLIACDIEKVVVRAISEPPTSLVIKGPREGFNESIKYNLALLRRRAKTDDLVITDLEVGSLTKTKVSVLYFNSVADKKIVNEVLKRLSKIKIDGVVDSHYLVSYLSKNPHSLFKQVGDTEKPDILVAKMLEGRVGILVDGSPIALTLPFILIEDLQNSDDYYSQPVRVSFVRLLRIIGVIIAVLLPGVYIALEIFHYKILPTEFLVTIMNTTNGIPFSPFIEVVFVILLFEILYEANLRMPQYLGIATSIVGALILGETAVNAGLVSPPAVMIVALSGITFYIIPSQVGQFSVLRLIGCVVGACLGVYGMLLYCVYIVSYLASFDSYKSPYLAPSAPFILDDQKDFILRKPLNEMKKRPKSIPNNSKHSNREETEEEIENNNKEKKRNKAQLKNNPKAEKEN